MKKLSSGDHEVHIVGFALFWPLAEVPIKLTGQFLDWCARLLEQVLLRVFSAETVFRNIVHVLWSYDEHECCVVWLVQIIDQAYALPKQIIV